MQSKVIKPSKSSGKSPKSFLDFLNEYKAALDEGWELPKTVTVRDFPVFATQFAVVMYKEKEEVVVGNEPLGLLDILEDKSLTKADLKVLCEANGIEYPDFPQPAKVRKHIIEAVKAKQESESKEEQIPVSLEPSDVQALESLSGTNDE
jgi:hypothetical protein